MLIDTRSATASSLAEPFPYPSQRMPVMARNIVATSQPLAAQAGLSMLQSGGNAVDAAIATAIALTVVEPTSNGIGSDAFAIVWDGAALTGLNASGRAPNHLTADFFTDAGRTLPSRGIHTVTIPGCVSAWSALSKKFGKLPFSALFQPAIGYARHGFLVSPITAANWQAQAQTIEEPDFRRDFLRERLAPAAGTFWSMPEQATTLELIAATHGEAFYRGALAAKIAAHAQALGGKHTLKDFATHQPEWVTPVSTAYRGYELHEIPPNGQGIAACMALGILQHHPLASLPVDSAASIHLQIEAMKLAFADVYAQVADPSAMQRTTAELLDPAYLKSRAALIGPMAGAPVTGFPRDGGTVYLTAADASGMMVSMIQSNYMGFGSGVVVPGTGIALQNRGAGFNLVPGHPNVLAGGKRPFHTIIPGFLTHNGAAQMSFGVMGGHMQPQGHVQMVTRLVDYGQNPQAASDAPRWIVNPDGTIGLEQGVPTATVAALIAMGHQVAHAEGVNFGFGGAQLIWKKGDHYIAGSDHRKDGCAVGF